MYNCSYSYKFILCNNRGYFLIPLIIIFIFCACQSNYIYNEVPKSCNLYKDIGTLNVYNSDNKIYLSEKKFVYEIAYYNKNNTLCDIVLDYSNCKVNECLGSCYTTKTDTIINNRSNYVINNIILEVYAHANNNYNLVNDEQTIITYQYKNKNDKLNRISEQTGVKENLDYVYLHQPRDNIFGITEYSSPPYVLYPLFINKKYELNGSIYKEWAERLNFKNPRGTSIYTEYNVVNQYYKKVKGFNTLEIYEIEATSNSEYGTSNAKFLFNKKYGFIELDYLNIDSSRVLLKLIKVI